MDLLGILLLGLIGGVLIGAALGYSVGREAADANQWMAGFRANAEVATYPDPTDAAGA